MIRLELPVAIAVMGSFAVLIAGMFLTALLRARQWHKRVRLSAQLLPQIQEALINYLAGSEDLSRLRQFAAASRRDFSSALVGFQTTVSGAARDRLCGLALELSLVHDWREDIHSRDAARRRAAFGDLAFVCCYEPCRRVAGDLLSIALDDSDPEVRLSAARSLADYGETAEIERVFGLATSQNLLIRIFLTGDLRRHAIELCGKAVPEALASGDRGRILATLDMLAAWQRAIPFEDLLPLTGHTDRQIRIQALELLPLVPGSPENRSAVLRSLDDPDTGVCVAAARVAARMGLMEGMPQLVRCVRDGAPGLARAAAATLSAMPPAGWKALEELSGSPNTVAANAASEALRGIRRGDGT